MKKGKNRFERILLVNPPEVGVGDYTSSPLGLLYLAAYLKEKNKSVFIAVVDGTLGGEKAVVKKVNEFRPDLVGITAMTPGRHQALRVARMVKKTLPRCKVILGGIHPTLMWGQMMEYYPEVDYIVRGEGEITLSELVAGKKLENIDGLVWWNNRGSVINNNDRALIRNLDDLPFLAWEMVDFLKYPSRGEGKVRGIDLEKEVRFPIIFSRGCMGACVFCSSWKVWKGYRSRSGKNVADEVELLVKKYKAKHICFYDDTFGGNRGEVISFCREIIKRKIKVAIIGTTRVGLVDEKLLGWMKKAGFYELAFGVESGSPRILAKLNKKTDLIGIKRAIFLTKKAGIKAVAFMMYGLPEETGKDKKLTEELLDEMKPDAIGTVGQTWIFPGTALYQQAKRAGLLRDSFWLGRRPYYIYRGGIGNDPINWELKISDFLKFHLSGTFFNKIRIKILLLKERVFGKKEVVRIKTPCFLCGNQKSEKLFNAQGFWIVRCQKCGQVVTLDKNLKRAYRPNIEKYEEKNYLEFYLGKETQKMIAERSEKRLQEIKKLTRGKKILDVGCSYGVFLKAAQGKGWQAEGVEPCKKTVRFLRKNTNLKVYYGTLPELRLNKKFDVVSYWDVLEHTLDPVEELRVASKYLKKGGILALQMPNFDSLLARIAKQRFGWLCPDEHLNHFTPKTLSLTLKKAGFKILQIKTWSGETSHFLSLFDALFPEKKSIRLVRLVFLKLGVFIDRFLPFVVKATEQLQSLFYLNGLIIIYAKKTTIKED